MNLYRRLHPETFREEPTAEPHGLALLSRAERRAGIPNIVPLVERREPPFVAPWRQRALAQRDRLGNVAVADLTGSVAQ